jgi:hypothetical protein
VGARGLTRIALWIAAGLTAIVAVACVAFTPRFSGRVEALDGRSLTGAHVSYRYRGSRFNFVDSLSYERPGGVLRTGADGSFEIPGLWHLRKPLDGRLQPWIEWVYVPEFHHAYGPIGPLTDSRPGLTEVDWQRGSIRLADLSADPEGWERTVQLLQREGLTGEADAEARALAERHPEQLAPGQR